MTGLIGQLETHRRPPGFLARVRGSFLTGLIILAPGVLTAYIVWTVVTFIDAKVVPLVPAAYNPSILLGIHVPGFGVIIFIIATSIIGALTKNLFGRQIVRYGEGLVERMPVVSSVYTALKQMMETILSQTDTSFKQACLVEFPRKGMWGLGFVTSEARGEIARKIAGVDVVSVFLPTTPNPTSGYLLYLPRSEVLLLDLSVEAALKLIISGGLVGPAEPGETPEPAR